MRIFLVQAACPYENEMQPSPGHFQIERAQHTTCSVRFNKGCVRWPCGWSESRRYASANPRGADSIESWGKTCGLFSLCVPDQHFVKKGVGFLFEMNRGFAFPFAASNAAASIRFRSFLNAL